MSKHITITQFKKGMDRSKTEIDKVSGDLTALSGQVIKGIKNGSTELTATDNTVDIGPAIAAAVAASDHLTRKIVDSKDAIDPAAEGADKFIYMVPKTGSDEDDLYDEYMVLDGSVEHVGNTKVDLSEYAKKSELPQVATDAEVDAMLTEVFGASAVPET